LGAGRLTGRSALGDGGDARSGALVAARLVEEMIELTVARDMSNVASS
jgi:hypothetical protein